MSRGTPEFTPTSHMTIKAGVPFRLPNIYVQSDIPRYPSHVEELSEVTLQIHTGIWRVLEDHFVAIQDLQGISVGRLRSLRKVNFEGADLDRLSSGRSDSEAYINPVGHFFPKFDVGDGRVQVEESTLPRQVEFALSVDGPIRFDSLGFMMIYRGGERIGARDRDEPSLVVARPGLYLDRVDDPIDGIILHPFCASVCNDYAKVLFPPAKMHSNQDFLRYPWWVIYDGARPPLENLYRMIDEIDHQQRQENAQRIMASIEAAASSETDNRAPSDLSETHD